MFENRMVTDDYIETKSQAEINSLLKSWDKK